jgi:hypothetical protein
VHGAEFWAAAEDEVTGLKIADKKFKSTLQFVLALALSGTHSCPNNKVVSLTVGENSCGSEITQRMRG